MPNPTTTPAEPALHDPTFRYCECECGARFREVVNGQVDVRGTYVRAYRHYISCDTAFERAPQLIVEMARTLQDLGIQVPGPSEALP